MQDLHVRPYSIHDFHALLNVDGRPSKRRENKLNLVEALGSFWCMVAQISKLEGFIIMEDLGDEDKKSHYMVQINVAERRRGTGRCLVVRVFEEIGPGGHVSLCVNQDNDEAQSFYEAMGFEISGVTYGYRKSQDKFWYAIDL